jgi:farnesyl-diphosphate farnesyltransferase
MSANLEDLLEKTSRTFALCVPLLPEPTRREVMVAYLLFRIADTFEDASHWPAAARIDALHRFNALLGSATGDGDQQASAEWLAAGPSSHAGYNELIAEVPGVLEAFRALQPGAVPVVRDHVLRSAEGMAAIVARTSPRGELELRDLEDLKGYCYIVAGIVGEMLTELFLLGRPGLAAAAPYLRERSVRFGEALQLVNILKDSAGDVSEGRRYLPPGVPLAEVFSLARKDLDAAAEYILALQEAGAPRGLLAFTALPVQLAWAALEKVERRGPGAKVSRPEVFLISRRLNRALDRGQPPVRLPRAPGRTGAGLLRPEPKELDR